MFIFHLSKRKKISADMLECQMVKSSNISIYLKSRILSYILCIIFYCFYYTLTIEKKTFL